MDDSTGVLPDLRRSWVSIDLPGYRPHPSEYSLYSHFDPAELPPIERPLDDELRWLLEEARERDSLADDTPMHPEPARRPTAANLLDLLGPSAARLPRSFGQFMTSVDARSRVRSTTACYVDLGDFAVPVVGGGKLVHFLSDQQWAMHWLLFVGDSGSEAVLVTGGPHGFLPDDGSPHAFSDRFEPATDEAIVCAESFSEWLYRFWIENRIWFALADPEGERRPLSVAEEAYVSHYR